MVFDSRLARLDEHQATILDIIRRAERMLGHADRDAAGLARARWELARAIMAYQGFKHREIFDPVAGAGDAARAHAARRLKADCIAVGDAFRAYVARWSAVSVLDRWDEYHAAAMRLIADIRGHLVRERADAAALLADRAA